MYYATGFIERVSICFSYSMAGYLSDSVVLISILFNEKEAGKCVCVYERSVPIEFCLALFVDHWMI